MDTLQGLPLTMLILGGQSMLNLERIHVKTLQGLPLTVLILGGQLILNFGKDLQTHCKDYL